MVHLNTTPEERNEIVRLGFRQLFALFPIAGPILNDVLFTYRNNVKQERLNHFISQLEEAFSMHGIKLEQLKSEEALDLLEQTINKVACTRSAEKRIAFKNLLTKGIIYPGSIAECEVFSDLLNELKEVQVFILAEHKKYLCDGQPLLQKLNELNNSYRNNTPGETFVYTNLEAQINKEMLSSKINDVQRLLEKYSKQCNAAIFGLEVDQYHYFLRDLISKGLLIDQGVGTYDPTPLKYMAITTYGLKFLDFILDK